MTKVWITIFRGLKGKMFVMILVPTVATLMIFTVNFVGINRLVKSLSIANEEIIPSFRAFQELTWMTGKITGDLFSIAQLKSRGSRTEVLGEVDESLEELNEQLEDFDKKYLKTDDSRKAWTSIQEGLDGYLKAIDKTKESYEKFTSENDILALEIIQKQIMPYSQSFLTFLDDLADGKMDAAAELYENASKESQAIRWLS